MLGRYRLRERLGSGGFGVVWLAEDERLERLVAVKRIPVDDPAVAARAQREARAAARLSHPGIVALYEAGRDEDAVYLVSELVRGVTLGDLMADGSLSDRDVVLIGGVLCAALEHAHGRGVVHRDVKPQNVIVPESTVQSDTPTPAKLTDFGIARLLDEDVLTRTGDVVGTLAYMAPEQAEGNEATAQADLYALGVVLYEGLAGVNPIRGRTPAATARLVGTRLPALAKVRRDLPPELTAAVDRAVSVDPRERGTAPALRKALKAAEQQVDDVPGVVEAGRMELVTRATRLAVTRRQDRTLGRAPWRPRREAAWAKAAAAGGVGGGAGSETPWAREQTGEDPGGSLPRRGRLQPAGRLVAALGAGGLAVAALATLGPEPPLAPLAGGVLAAAAAAVLPRLGPAALAAALLAWLLTAVAGGSGDGLAVVVAAVAVPTLLLAWGAGPGWLVTPPLAPLLGAAAVAGAWPAIAGQAKGVAQRVALGALGCWWVLLTEAATHHALLLGVPAGVPERRLDWAGDAGRAASDVLGPVLSSGALGIAAVWALGAAVLPYMVRGRVPAVDIVGAVAWAAGLAAATQAVATAVSPGGAAPRGLVGSAVLAGLLAVGARASRGPS